MPYQSWCNYTSPNWANWTSATSAGTNYVVYPTMQQAQLPSVAAAPRALTDREWLDAQINEVIALAA